MTATFQGDSLQIGSRGDIPRAIAMLQRMGEPASLRVPVLQALYRGELGFLDVERTTTSRLVKAFLAAVELPAMVIVGDDGDAPVGPKGFPSTERLMRWARRIVIHGTGGEVWQYQSGVDVARVCGRLLWVECPSRLIEDYRSAAKRWGRAALVQTVQPFHGQSHPAPVERASLQ